MKKFWNLMLAALVIFGAVACTENQEEFVPQVEKEAVLSIVANIADDTRVDLEQVNGVWETVWSENETLIVYANGEEYTFTNENSEDKSVFTCYDEGVLGALNQPVEIGNGYVDSKNGKNGAWIHTVLDSFDPTANITLTVMSSFFRFTSDKDVTLTTSVDTFIVDGWPSKSVTLPAGEDIWVAFLPADNCTFSYSIDGVTIKEIKKNFERKKIYNLGTLVVSNASEYGVVGSFQTPTTWDVAAPAKMTHVASDWNWVVAKNVELYKSDEFKVVTGNSWDNPNFGAKDAVLVAEPGKVNTLTQGGQNIKVNTNGKFNLYFNPTSKEFKYEVVEEYTDLMVNITIDNKANWSPLYITLESGDTTVADKATVTNNKYAVSGAYIGETLSYVLSSGSKEMEGNVSITKDGATILLEETVIKLKVQLNTANAKQWWGGTMKIHAWNTGTSFDTSWPGNPMTSEGNYTWSIVVPSELVDKTINFLVHNGDGWQSKDSTVTIKAEGNTVTGSSIGIN